MLKRAAAKSAKFLREEDGNTTIDWVVLVSGLLGLTLIVMASIGGGVTIFGDKASTELSNREAGRF